MQKIGLFFLFLGHYTTWLLPAAIVGFFAWINVASDDNKPVSAYSTTCGGAVLCCVCESVVVCLQPTYRQLFVSSRAATACVWWCERHMCVVWWHCGGVPATQAPAAAPS
jgi:hypothetical protein